MNTHLVPLNLAILVFDTACRYAGSIDFEREAADALPVVSIAKVTGGDDGIAEIACLRRKGVETRDAANQRKGLLLLERLKKNRTVPVGVPPLGELTLAVKVNSSPAATGLIEAVRVVSDTALTTDV